MDVNLACISATVTENPPIFPTPGASFPGTAS
jgi:hypothetical protein